MALVGVQPLLTQVPPNLPCSTIPTRMPWPARRAASDGPAWPMPITMASNLALMAEPPVRGGAAAGALPPGPRDPDEATPRAYHLAGARLGGGLPPLSQPEYPGVHSP